MGKFLFLETLIAAPFVWVPALASSLSPSDNSLFHDHGDNRRNRDAFSIRSLQEKSTFETLNTVGVLSTLNQAIQQARLEDTLQGAGPYTVIMPWNKAFETLDQDMWGKLMTDPKWILHLQDVILCHVHQGGVPYEAMETMQRLPMVNGDDVGVELLNQQLYFNDAQTIAYDVTTDGNAYMTKKVLLPSFLSKTIFDIAASTSTISTLTSLLVTAGLDNALRDQPGAAMTLFAPSNEAFSVLDPQTLAFLQTLEGLDQLENILLYHVLPIVVPSMNIQEGTSQVETLTGDSVTITKTNLGAVLADSATVTGADNLAMDGIVHIIDAVLLPPEALTGEEGEQVEGNELDSPKTGTDPVSPVPITGDVSSARTIMTISRTASLSRFLGISATTSMVAAVVLAFN